MKTVSKSSFTLFELLVVILIISILYAIFVERLSSKESTLPSEGEVESIAKLLKRYDFNESAELVCTEKCKQCFIFVDQKKTESIDSPFEEEVNVYDYDIHGILSKIHFQPIFDENDNPTEVCFRYAVYPNGSSSSYILEYQKKFYIFYPYFHTPKKAISFEQAAELFDPSKWIPTDSAEYNF